jgi:hypothetical protein
MTRIVKNIIPAQRIMAAIIMSGPNHSDGHGHSSHHHIIMIASAARVALDLAGMPPSRACRRCCFDNGIIIITIL